jgi:hypothetical protein
MKIGLFIWKFCFVRICKMYRNAGQNSWVSTHSYVWQNTCVGIPSIPTILLEIRTSWLHAPVLITTNWSFSCPLSYFSAYSPCVVHNTVNFLCTSSSWCSCKYFFVYPVHYKVQEWKHITDIYPSICCVLHVSALNSLNAFNLPNPSSRARTWDLLSL